MRIPAQLEQRAREIVFGGSWSAPQARPASTVVLLRDNDGIEVALLQRATTLAFAKDMYVFPGGAIDPGDADLGDPWLVAAIRETFEEAGVLLATPNPADPSGVRGLEFEAALDVLDVSPDIAALHFFAHWVTPEVETRRFDTRFYASRLPAGQDLGAFTSEHQNIGWYRTDVQLPMLPPTAAVLAELRQFASVDEALAVERDPFPVMPHPIAKGEDIEWVLLNVQTGQPL